MGWIILDVVYLSTGNIKSQKKFEARIWKTFLQLIERTLKMYPTTIKEDEELLRGEIKDQVEKNCIIFRLEQKKVLKDMVEIGKIINQALKV